MNYSTNMFRVLRSVFRVVVYEASNIGIMFQ